MRHRFLHATFTVSALAALAVGCGRASAERTAEAAADSVRDSAVAQGAPVEVAERRAEQVRTTVLARERAREAAEDSAAARERRMRNRPPLEIAEGTTLELAAVTDITSHTDHAGDAFVARTTSAALNASGDTVIPVGAELVGRVTELRSAPTPSDTGKLAIAFDLVRFGAQEQPISVNVVRMGTRSVARGITVEDAAKVGVGAAVGAAAGRIIGRNRTGAAVGAAGGAAAGAVYANRTKDHDIVLSPGSAITVVLKDSFRRQIATGN